MKKTFAKAPVAALALALPLCGAMAQAPSGAAEAEAPVTNEWVRAASSDALASNPANWSLGHSPLTNETVRFGAENARNVVWDAAASHSVAGWVQEEGFIAVATVMTTPAPGGFNALRIGGDFIMHGGALTHPRNGAAEDFWLSLDIGGSLIVDGSALISVSGKGYAPGAGPSPSVTPGAGASHGGQGAPHAERAAERPALTYGSILEPSASGSGGTVAEGSTNAYHGGGAFVASAGRRVIINGAVRADADGRDFGGDNLGGAAGGSVNIRAGEGIRVDSGWVSADGGRGWGAGAGGGGGGRVALVSRGGGVPTSTSRVTAYGGVGDSKAPDKAIADRHIRGAAGTVYLAPLDDQNPRSGSVYVRDWHRPSLAATRIPPDIGAGAGELRDAQLCVDANAFVMLPQSFSVRAISFQGGGLDLNGNTLSTGSAVNRSNPREVFDAPGVYDSPDVMQFDTVIFNGGRISVNTYFKPIF